MMFRRSFGTIHQGHLPEGTTLESWWDNAKFTYLGGPEAGFTAGAFALEEGSKTKRKHIQFYVEHSRKRPSTLKRQFGLSTEAVFDKVRDAKGSWNYCTGTGTHAGKEALSRFTWGDPKLSGSSSKADLKLLVGLVCEGVSLEEICMEYPYAWSIHAPRLRMLARDRLSIQKNGSLAAIPAMMKY